MTPLTIAQVVPTLAMGGMERMVCDLLAEIQRSGNRGVLFCTDGTGAFWDEAPASARAVGRRSPFLLGFDARLLCAMVSYLRRERVDVIHAHNLVAQLYATIAGKLLRLPSLVTVHGQGVTYGGRSDVVRHLLGRMTNVSVAVSRDAARVLLSQRAVPHSRMRVVANGVPLAVAEGLQSGPPAGKEQAREGLGIPQDVTLFGSVGRLWPEKNYEMLIDAFRALALKSSSLSNASPVYLVLVGDGGERERICAHIRQAGIEDAVLLPGYAKDVSMWLRAMDVFCLSSSTEGMSLSLLEACMAGVPTIVTDVGGSREVVEDGVTGIVVPEGDSGALSDAMRRLWFDSALRRSMGKKAHHKAVSCFDFRQTFNQYMAIYRELTG